MPHNERDLSEYRLLRAREDMETAAENLAAGKYKASVNRSYYAIFHAIRAVNALDSFDSSKHSGVISHFNEYHVHNGDFEKDTYKIIDSVYRIREKCDYSDFYITSKAEAEEQLEKARRFLSSVESFLNPPG